MRPETKIEKEVCGYKLPDLSTRQTGWARSLATLENATTHWGRKCTVVHFCIVTTHRGWQVIRQFYLYQYFRYRKQVDFSILEVMQHWMKEGHYVFLCRNRNAQGYCNDAWLFGQPMTLKRGDCSTNCLSDPRDIVYDAVRYVKVQRRFAYIPKGLDSRFMLSDLYRAVNASSYAETLIRQDEDAFRWCLRYGFAYDAEKMAAVKIARRHGYDYRAELWKDLVGMLKYLGKDLHNPALVCPGNLMEAHNHWSVRAANKRFRMMNAIQKARMIAQEKERLAAIEREAERERKRKEEMQSAVSLYPKLRGRFFGMVIAEEGIEIKVLQSVREFFEEGKEMDHCVFSNGYYDLKENPDCLILSARVDGKRTETIEIDLSEMEIVQCRGRHNVDSPYHERIMGIMQRNMDIVEQYNRIVV
jgi:hypothetical protein